MSSSLSLNNPRYRPALLALAGICTAYAIYLIRQRYVGADITTSEPQVQLRRRNAVRRHDSSRHRRRQSTSQEEDSMELTHAAMEALQTREESGRSYGFLDINSIEYEGDHDRGHRRETQWPLLPSLLPTAQDFQNQEGVSAEEGRGLRNHAELMFMDSFLVNQFPTNYTIAETDANYLVEQLANMGIASLVAQQRIERFNTDPNFGAEMRRQIHLSAQSNLVLDHATGIPRLRDPVHALDGGETTADEHSNFDWREGHSEATAAAREEQNTLDLLYNIARDQARKDGYIHRGVECNGCGIMPIQGIRYRCANCLDFDLCDSCESHELHIKTHVFYKIRVPAPSLGALGNSRHCLPLWYPGKPGAMPRSLSRELSCRLLRETGFEESELEALWDQFRCLAATEWSKDPNKLGMAIDRKTFDKCFVPPLSIRPPPPNLIYDRMFAMYDIDNDGLIGFEEFLKGLASLNDKSRDGRLRRIFQGYDMDNDGYVDRKDFLRMFRAFYTLSKELNRELVATMEEDLIEGGARDIVHGSQPISAAFPGSIPHGHASRHGAGKDLDAHGDFVITDNGGVLDEDREDVADRHQVIADYAVRSSPRPSEPRSFPQNFRADGSLVELVHTALEEVPMIGSPRSENPLMGNAALANGAGPLPYHQSWPPVGVRTVDVVNALGSEVSLSEIMDPVDRSRVVFAQSERIDREWHINTNQRRHDAVQERWRRRRFYTDVEEGGTAPEGYNELDSSDDEPEARRVAAPSVTSTSISRPISPRSRSSSKVRFEDSVTDTDHETRSNTSSRSIPVGERWGGYDISEVEKDAGKEILYQAVQQGFNELLDQLFKEKETLAMDSHLTRKMRRHYSKEIQAFAKSIQAKSHTAADGSHTAVDGQAEAEAEEAYNNNNDITNGLDTDPDTRDAEIRRLLERSGYSMDDISSDTGLDPDENSNSNAGQTPAAENRNPPHPPRDHPIYTGAQTYALNNPPPDTQTSSPSPLPPPPPPPPPPAFHPQPFDPTMPQFLPNDPDTISPNPTSIPPQATSPPSPSPALAPSPAPALTTTTKTTSTSQPPTSPLPPPPPPPPLPPLSKNTLIFYLHHEIADAQARARGGFGRLNFEEFMRGMVGEEEEDEDDEDDVEEDEDAGEGNSGGSGGGDGDGDGDDRRRRRGTGTRRRRRRRTGTGTSSGGGGGTGTGTGRRGQQGQGQGQGHGRRKKWSRDGGMGRLGFLGAWIELACF